MNSSMQIQRNMHSTTRSDARRDARPACWLILCCILLLSIVLSSCADGSTTSQSQTIQSSSAQQITYSTDPKKVLIRLFYGGGLYGSFQPAPQLSIYGDGTYILGTEQQGKLNNDDLQHLLTDLIDSYNLTTLKRQQFSDVPDQNATYLELALNGKTQELVYGPFGSRQESTQDLDEYQRLGKAITAINNALKGPTQPFTANATALLTRQVFGASNSAVYWPLTDLSLSQAALFECGPVRPSSDEVDPNQELGCLKYTIPNNVLLLTGSQLQVLKNSLDGQSQGTFLGGNGTYEVRLRPLLPDEIAQKTVAMFGSAQSSYKSIPLHEGPPPES